MWLARRVYKAEREIRRMRLEMDAAKRHSLAETDVGRLMDAYMEENNYKVVRACEPALRRIAHDSFRSYNSLGERGIDKTDDAIRPPPARPDLVPFHPTNVAPPAPHLPTQGENFADNHANHPPFYVRAFPLQSPPPVTHWSTAPPPHLYSNNHNNNNITAPATTPTPRA